MNYNNDSGRYLRESIRNLGETYNRSRPEDDRDYKFKSYPLPRVVLGIIGLGFVFTGLKLMESTFHLSIKFVGLALFGSGLIISVQLLGVIGAGIIGLIHRGLSRGKKK